MRVHTRLPVLVLTLLLLHITVSVSSQVCTKAWAWDEALKLLGSLESRGISPSEELYGTTLEACVSAQKHDEALEVNYYMYIYIREATRAHTRRTLP